MLENEVLDVPERFFTLVEVRIVRDEIFLGVKKREVRFIFLGTSQTQK